MENIITETLMPIHLSKIETLNIVKPKINNNIAIVFDNFLRDEITFNLIESIFHYAPGVKLYIADQSVYHPNTTLLYNKLIENGHEIIYCGFDCGISVARNKAIEQVKEDYIFLCDCDNLFTENTNLTILKNILDSNPQIGFLSLYEKENNEINHYEINFNRCHDKLTYIPIENDSGCRLKKFFFCDYTMNVGLTKKDVFSTVKYDENMKLAEHLDFFLSLKYNTPWKVACATTVYIDNRAIELNNSIYSKFRGRNKIYWKLYCKKWNLIQINDYILESEKFVKPDIKKETNIQPNTIIESNLPPIKNIILWINKHGIPFYLVNKTCLNFINHKPLDLTKFNISTNNHSNKTLIEDYAKNINLDIDVVVENKNTKTMEVDDMKINVPMPVVKYLKDLYGPDWEKL